METNKLIGLLGMCRRAGRLTVGFDAVVALCGKTAPLVMLASDASERTVRQLRFHAGDTTVYRLPLNREETAHAVGSSKPVAVLATEDKGFVRAIRPLLTTIQEEES